MTERERNDNEFDPVQTPCHFLTKRELAKLYSLSTRTIDKFLTQGLPHLAIGARRVRIEAAQAHAWMRERFGTRRLATRRQSIGSQ
jgi:predicted DNA-binding transcriptional regulator AlpA